MPNELVKLLPQQWVGWIALLLILTWVATQLVEKYEAIAKVVPLGAWWHDRQRRRAALDPASMASAIETARRTWLTEENQALTMLEGRIASIAKTSQRQADDIKGLQDTVRVFTAWSVYDARWHHKLLIENSETVACNVPQHYDFFEFEQLWHRDPMAAVQLS